MKRMVTVVITSVVTVLVLLVILWKLEIIYLNVSKPTEKVKEFVGKDELSELLKLEYPKLGENLQVAHTLFGEPAFETSDQKDFDLLDGQATIYVAIDEKKETIESFQIYVKGEKNKVASLGKKFLPAGSTLIKDKQDEIERKNETMRYTRTEYLENYYYTLPGGESFALISISNDESDLIESNEETDNSEILYDLEVSYISEEDVRYDLGMYDSYVVVDGEITSVERHSDELVTGHSDDTEPVEEEPHNQSIPRKDSFSDEVIQLNNEKVKHQSFLQHVASGQIDGITVPLNVTIRDEIDAHIGQPDWKIESEGGYYLMYEECSCGFGVEYDYEEMPDAIIHSYYLPISLTREEIIQALGEPTEEGLSELDNGEYLFYRVGDYELFFEKSATPSLFDSVILR